MAGLSLECLRFCGLVEPSAHIQNLHTFGRRLKTILMGNGETLSASGTALCEYYADHTRLDAFSILTCIVRAQAVALLMHVALTKTSLDTV